MRELIQRHPFILLAWVILFAFMAMIGAFGLLVILAAAHGQPASLLGLPLATSVIPLLNFVMIFCTDLLLLLLFGALLHVVRANLEVALVGKEVARETERQKEAVVGAVQKQAVAVEEMRQALVGSGPSSSPDLPRSPPPADPNEVKLG